MNRLQRRFNELRAQGRKALIPYITAGDPHPTQTVGLLHELVKAGADVLELGVPFSDPMADGPVIQLACERALAHGTGLTQVLDMVAEFRQSDSKTPVVLMGYMNPIETLGVKAFATRAREVGVDGVILVDLALEETPEYLPTLIGQGIDCIFLLAPTSSAERIAAIAKQASGYLYYVSLKGVTGAATLDVASVAAKLMQIRRQTNLPLCVGFGIRDAASAKAVGKIADGVVVGSALVSTVEKFQDKPKLLAPALSNILAPMRAALDEIK
ncbi:MAG TPA: tryptophan synthase subunit alpha [Nevskiaceae bacterium]|nr:tryptophan synthase subunit alpha [Nevskiaceae bacterium]